MTDTMSLPTTPTPVEQPVFQHHLTITHGVLRSALLTTAAAIPRRPAVPVLGGVHISSDRFGTYVTAADYETAVRVTVGPPTGVAPAVVSHQALARIVRALAGTTPARVRDLPVGVAWNDSRVQVSADGYRYTVPSMPAADWPPPAVLTGRADRTSTVLADDLLGTLRRVRVAAGTDDTLPMLTGIRAEFAGDQVTFAATDRFRLAVSTVPGRTRESWDTLIPAAALWKAAQRLSGPVQIARVPDPTGTSLRAHDAVRLTDQHGLMVAIRTIDVDFVKYRSLIPDTTPIYVRTGRADLIEAVRRAAAFVDLRWRGARALTLELAAGALTISNGGPDEARAETPALAVDGAGEIRLALHAKYLLDGLAAVDGEKVTIGLTTPSRPIVLSNGADQNRHLIMPARPAD